MHRGGKGALIQEDVSATLATTNNQTLFQHDGCVNPWDPQSERVYCVGDDPYPTLSANSSGGQNRQAICYSIDGCIARGAHMGQNGKGWSDDGASPTLSTLDVPAVAFAQSRHRACTQYGEDIAGTITARHDSSPCADREANVVCMSDDNAKSAVDDDMCGTLKRGGGTPFVAFRATGRTS